jgi:DNA-binding MarR family transcriptional regulator
VLQGRPLYDTRADARYFVLPTVWNALMRAIDRELNVLVIGARGAGKTTLLHQAELALRQDGDRVAFVDATAVSEPAELSARLRDALRGRPSAMSAGIAGLRVAAGDPAPPPGGAPRLIYDNLSALASVEPTTIFVDASGSAEATYGIFGRMRDAVWQLPHQWVVAADEAERATIVRPPADAFFDTTIALERLSTEQLIELLEKRDETVSERDRVRIAAGANGSPRDALRALNHAVVHGLAPDEQWTQRTRALEQAGELGRPYAMLMAELLDLGQASPSDEDLQHRLGLSRGRITQLLRGMLEKGLVEAETDRPDKPGRPRTIYRPTVEGET